MDDRYSLSSSNKVYFCVVAILYVAVFFLSGEKTAFQSGQLTGNLLVMFLFPLLFSWIVWRVSGRGKRGGSWTFNIVLTLALLGQFNQFSRRQEVGNQLEEMQVHKEEFKRKISASESGEESIAATREFSESVLDSLNAVQAATTGTESEIYGIMTELLKESQAAGLRWNESFRAIQEERILDYSLLHSDDEFRYQLSAIQQYIEDTRTYEKCSFNFVPELKDRLADFAGNEVANGVIAGAQKSFNRGKQTLGSVLKAHGQYGAVLLELVELLQQNGDSWTFENNELSFEDDNLLRSYNEKIDVLIEIEEKINVLSERHIQNL